MPRVWGRKQCIRICFDESSRLIAFFYKVCHFILIEMCKCNRIFLGLTLDLCVVNERAEAVEDANKAIELDPLLTKAYLRKGYV